MDVNQRKQLLEQEFYRRFGCSPVLWVQAPGRVDLMGSHTDYNQGYVLTMAIDRTTWLAARPRDDRQVVIYSLNLEGGGPFSLDRITPDTQSPWTNYIRGVAAVFAAAGYPLRGFDGLIHSTIPFGSGLSSSAAVEVAAAQVFTLLNGGLDIPPVQMARLCQQAENEFVGVNSGILDQYSSLMGREGHALLLDCRHLTHQTIPLPEGVQVVICDTRAKRELTGSEYGERRAQCEAGAAQLGVSALRDLPVETFYRREAELPDILARRCRFIVEENQRVLDLADAFTRGDLAAIDRLTAASFIGARHLYQIVSPEMEAMMQAMRTGPGVIGARQAGAGFGGCMVAFVHRDATADFAAHVQSVYHRATGVMPGVYPAQAAAGAGRLVLEAENV